VRVLAVAPPTHESLHKVALVEVAASDQVYCSPASSGSAAVLRSLVTVESGTATSRAASLAAFLEGSPGRALIEALLHPEARLLVSDTDGGEVHLRLAHEALLSHWPRARDQVVGDARDLELRARLEQEAERWRAAPRRRDKAQRVVSGLLLAEARGLTARWRTELPREVREFVAASARAARWRRVRLWSMVAGAPVAAMLLAAIIWTGLVWWGVRQVEAEWAANNEFVRTPAGCFQMGSPDSEPERHADEGLHRVCVKAFDLAKFTVTQREWRRVMIGLAGFPNNPNPSYFWGDDRLPVEEVSWNGAQRFIWLMSFFGRGHYRLPSESEYEYAARAGTTTSRYWGDNIDDGCAYENIADQSLKKDEPDISPVFANCDDGYARTAPVGSFKPNPWGLYDMLGNVAARTEDCYVNNYREVPADGSANISGPCVFRVARGGSWIFNLRVHRAANRIPRTPDDRNFNFGVRLVRSVPP
jgi:formylglycine-generating enzyme required for sulfatase activity